MVAESLSVDLEREGIDTTNLCNLTVGQLILIREAINEDGVNAQNKGFINGILKN